MAVNTVNQNTTAPVSGKEAAAAKKAKNVDPKSAANAYSAAQATQAGPGEAAAVQISPRAKEMAKALQAAKDAPDVREEKVAKYKEMIAKGQYKADSEKIAEGMVREAIRDEAAKSPEAVSE